MGGTVRVKGRMLESCTGHHGPLNCTFLGKGRGSKKKPGGQEPAPLWDLPWRVCLLLFTCHVTCGGRPE